MKKILLLLIPLIILTGCENKETTIKNPNGKSQTYKYLKQINYNPEKYTLKIKNKEEITISKNKKQTYYKNKTQKIIEKNYKKYTIQNNSYTEEPIITQTNYAKGYLPENMKTLKNQTYKTGKERKGILTYTYEKYTYQGGEVTYYFRNNKLTHIKNKTIQNEITVKFISLTTKINQKEYKLPKGIEPITY